MSDKHLNDPDIASISLKQPNTKDFCTLIDWTGHLTKDAGDEIFANLYPVKYNAHIYRLYAVCSNPKVKKGVFSETPGQIRQHDSSIMTSFAGIMIFDQHNFEQKLNDWKHYWDWKKNRNEARAALEEQHQFDTKFAMHAVRLMRTGLEILKFGRLDVLRPDAVELLDIRNGKYTYDQIMAHVADLEKEAQEIYDNKRYVVPYEPDRKAINELYKRIVAWPAH